MIDSHLAQRTGAKEDDILTFLLHIVLELTSRRDLFKHKSLCEKTDEKRTHEHTKEDRNHVRYLASHTKTYVEQEILFENV